MGSPSPVGAIDPEPKIMKSCATGDPDLEMGAFRNSKNRSLDLWSNGCESVTLVDMAEEDIFQKTLAFQIGKKEEQQRKEEKRWHSIFDSQQNSFTSRI